VQFWTPPGYCYSFVGESCQPCSFSPAIYRCCNSHIRKPLLGLILGIQKKTNIVLWSSFARQKVKGGNFFFWGGGHKCLMCVCSEVDNVTRRVGGGVAMLKVCPGRQIPLHMYWVYLSTHTIVPEQTVLHPLFSELTSDFTVWFCERVCVFVYLTTLCQLYRLHIVTWEDDYERCVAVLSEEWIFILVGLRVIMSGKISGLH
jgi:hypothetical protein